MILSHDYKFIFLKTSKAAGTSIEIALSKFCGSQDIITPLSPEDEDTRRQLGYRGPQKYLSSPWDYGMRDVAKLVQRRRRKMKFYNHMAAREVRALIGSRIWNEYFKFCFARNPWDRVVSLYYWRQRRGPPITIEEFVDSDAPVILNRWGFDLYTIEGQIAVDRVCRYESIGKELEAIREQLGLPESLDLPHAKSGLRKRGESYRELLGEKEKGRIAELFRDEINLLGYEF